VRDTRLIEGCTLLEDEDEDEGTVPERDSLTDERIDGRTDRRT